MTTADDNQDEPKDGEAPKASVDEAERASGSDELKLGETSLAVSEARALSADSETKADEEEGLETPAQLGGQRFVYAAYFTGAVAIAFLLSKAISFGWSRLSLWKPQLGEPDEMICVVSAAIIGALVAFYYYRDDKVRTLAEEVASELGQVSWPTRDEVVNGTFVVVVTTFLATAFFALMDRFWGFVTNLVYGA